MVSITFDQKYFFNHYRSVNKFMFTLLSLKFKPYTDGPFRGYSQIDPTSKLC